MATDNILEVVNLTKYYGGAVVTKALAGISLKVQKGEFVAVMGASGSGKSTLLNIISTIDKATGGDVFIDGKNIGQMKEDELAAFRRDRLGFVFQDYNLLDTLTVGENIALPLNLARKTLVYTESETHRVGKLLGVENEFDKYPRELSGGQRQRVALARALITSPALLLADEPTGALDSANSKGLMQTLSFMNGELGCTILMVTHDPVMGSYAGRVLFLKDGKIFTEIRRGDRDRKEMYDDILAVLATGGGDDYVR